MGSAVLTTCLPVALDVGGRELSATAMVAGLVAGGATALGVILWYEIRG